MRGKIDELILYHSSTIQVSTNSYITLEFIEILTVFLDFLVKFLWANSQMHYIIFVPYFIFFFCLFSFFISIFKVGRGSCER